MLILKPNEQPDEKTFNNAGVEDAFLANCWRFGGSAQEVPKSWRAAFLALLNSWKKGESLNHNDYLQQKATAWPRLVSKELVSKARANSDLISEDNEAFDFFYQAGSTTSEELDMWKYLLPRGSRLVPGGIVELDDGFNRLDDGFVLA